MKKFRVFKAGVLIVALVLIAGCQGPAQSDQGKEISYVIDRITLNNETDGVGVSIKEVKFLNFDNPDYLNITYTITNNTGKPISSGAYTLTFRAYSDDGLLLFECHTLSLFSGRELDPGKRAEGVSYNKVWPNDEVYEVVVDFELDLTWPGNWDR